MINPLVYTTPIMWVALVAVLAVFVAGIFYNFINKTVGMGFAFKLFKMKKKFNKDKILLKILMPNGKPQYVIKAMANLIEYDYKENGIKKIGMVKYDYFSMYKEYSDIPIIECDPHDILPRNPFVNTSLTVSGEMVKKSIVDSKKEDLSREEMRRWIKMAIPILAIAGIIIILYSSNQNEQVMLLTRDLASCWAGQGKAAVIIAG